MRGPHRLHYHRIICLTTRYVPETFSWVGAKTNTYQRQQGGRRGSGGGFDYPEPVNLAPVSSGAAVPGYASTSYYHPPGHERRPSPQSFAGSPHSAGFPPIPAHGTPPPASTPSAPRGGLNVRDILNNPTDQSNGGRSSTDSDMLNQLNRKV
jgi:hypothetical protein